MIRIKYLIILTTINLSVAEIDNSTINVKLDCPEIIPKKHFSITISPNKRNWHSSSVFTFQSESTILITYSPLNRKIVDSNNNFHIIHISESSSFTIYGVMRDYEEQSRVELKFIEGLGVKLSWSWMVALNSIEDMTLTSGHVDYMKKGNPLAFENDIIKITCEVIGGSPDNFLIIKLPPYSQIMFANRAINKPNYRNVFIKLSKSIYGKSIICFSSKSSELKVNSDILKFRIYETDFENNYHSFFFYLSIRGIGFVLVCQIIVTVYILVCKQRHFHIEEILDEKFDTIDSNLYITPSLPAHESSLGDI